MSSIALTPYTFTFPNGLTLIVEEDSTLPLATVQVWCATGSIHEGAHVGSGLSHLLEHLLFKGTFLRAPGTIIQEVRNGGAQINAYTQHDRTVYDITGPSTGVADAVDILADMMMNAVLPVEEFTKEKEVIRREFAMKADHPDVMSWEFLDRTMFRVSPFGEPVIGHLDIFNKLTREEVMAYYKKRYIPNNLCFIVVGDVDAEKMKAQLHALFEKYPRQPLEPVFVPEEPLQIVKRIERKPFSLKLSRLNMAWRGPGITSVDAPAMDVLGGILGLGNSSFLKQEVGEKKELVHDVFSKFRRVSQQEAFLWVRAVVDPLKREAAENEILHQVHLLKNRGVTALEVERSKNLLLSCQWRFLTAITTRAFNYGDGWLTAGDPCFQKNYFESISRITPEEVNRVAHDYLIDDRLTLTSLDPESVISPSSKKKKGSIEKKEKPLLQVQKHTLSNGLRLLICEDHRFPLISMTALFRGGLLMETAKNSGLTHLLANTMIKGTSSKTAEQIARKLEQVGGSINNNSCRCGDVVSVNDLFGLEITVMKPHVPVGLNLLAEILTDAIFSEEEVDREKNNQQAELKAQEERIRVKAQRLLQKKLFGTHPYARSSLGTPETIASLTPAMLREAYKHLVVGRNGVVTIVGDVTAEEIIAITEKAFEGMASGTLALSSVPSVAPLIDPIQEQAICEKEQAVIIKGFLGAAVTSPDRPLLELLSEACNGIGSRLFNQIREKMGLVYFINSWSKVGLAPESFTFCLGIDPEKNILARQELDFGIEHLVKEGLTQEELEQAKKALLQQEVLSYQSHTSFGKQIAREELMGLGCHYHHDRSEEIMKVTLPQMNEVIKKYLGVPGFVEVVVVPVSSIKLN